MTINTTFIRVDKKDLKIFRTINLNIFLDAYPEKKGLKISDRELFASHVKYYRGN